MVWTKKAQKLGNLNSRPIIKANATKRRKEYNKNPKICKLESCNNPISYKERDIQIFCSHSCSAKMNNEKNRKTPILYCKICDKRLMSGQNYTCSKQCSVLYWSKKTDDMIINGKIKKHYVIKNYLIKIYGRHCFICKRKTWMGKEIPIELDHIDGNNKNNVLTNLRLLCVNCHAQTPTWKFKKSRRRIIE